METNGVWDCSTQGIQRSGGAAPGSPSVNRDVGTTGPVYTSSILTGTSPPGTRGEANALSAHTPSTFMANVKQIYFANSFSSLSDVDGEDVWLVLLNPKENYSLEKRQKSALGGKLSAIKRSRSYLSLSWVYAGRILYTKGEASELSCSVRPDAGGLQLKKRRTIKARKVVRHRRIRRSPPEVRLSSRRQIIAPTLIAPDLRHNIKHVQKCDAVSSAAVFRLPLKVMVLPPASPDPSMGCRKIAPACMRTRGRNIGAA